jgi:hypothetical protein
MTAPATEIEHPEPHSDHQTHTAPAESHVIEKSLWRRIMDWRGTFFILSLLAHIVVIGVAAFLVVQVVQARKEKLKFTAPPPAPPAEHSVKPSKKTAAAAPAVTKRITSKAVNTSIALPTMEMNSSSPDIMSSVMSGMGAAGLGAGAAGGAGLASMSLAGLTSFGFKGNGAGIRGYLYDLKQTPGRMSTGVKDDASHLKVVNEFLDAGWDDAVLDKFYKAKDPMNTVQIHIPLMPATEAPKAFGVENEVKPGHWVIHYKGAVTAPKSGKFYFVGMADDLIIVRFNGTNVLTAGTLGSTPDKALREKYQTDNESIPQPPSKKLNDVRIGKSFEVTAGKSYPIDILISEIPGGGFSACLTIAEDKPEDPYYKSKTDSRLMAYPLFQMKRGLPLPEWKQGVLEISSKPTVFQAR